MGQTALLVIDVQNALIQGNPYGKEHLIQNLQTLIHAARKHKVEVIFVRHDDGVGSEFEVGTPLWQIHKSVSPLEGEQIFDKQFNSAFHKTQLHAYLESKNIQKLMVAGMQTEFCIDATIRSAFDLGYQVAIPEQAHTSFDNPYMTAEKLIDYYNHYMWHERYAMVLSMDEAVAQLIK